MSLRHQIPFVRSAILAASTAVAGMAGAQTLDTLEKYGNASTGAFTADGMGGYTITSNGTDLWGNSDNASFLHGGTTSGDFSAVVRQLGVDQIRSEWGRTGIIARTSTAANSAYQGHIRKNAGEAHGTAFQYRDTDAGNTSRLGSGGTGTSVLEGNRLQVQPANNIPIWMSLSRQGDTYYSSWAADLNGTPGRWSAADSKTGSTADVYVGLTHHSHGYGSNSGSTNWTNTASFDSYQVGSFNAGLQGTSGTYDVGGSIQAGGLALTGNAYTYNLSDGLATGERTGWKLEIYDGDNASQGLWTEVYEHMNINNTGYWDSILNFNGEPSLTYQGADTKFGRAASGLSYDTEMAALDRFTGSGGWAAETGANEAEVYSVRQWGEIFIPENGTYNFRDGTDDYFGLIVDGQTLVDDNSAAGPNGLNSGNPTPQGSITFSDVPSGGKWVPIELRMAEGGGGDNSILFWDYLPTDPSDPSAGGTINANGDYSSSTALGAGAEVPLAFLRSPDLIDSIMGSYQIGDESTFDVFRRDDGSPVDLGAGNYLINFTSFNTGVASTSFLVPFSVPEPSRALLLALGLVGFALRRRR